MIVTPRSPQGLACAGMAFIALAGALFSLALEIEFIVESPITGWTAWLSCISAASCAVCAIVVLAFQACRGTPRAPPQSPLGTMMCGIGLFWNAILLVCFVVGTFGLGMSVGYYDAYGEYVSVDYIGFAHFSDWEPKGQAYFIFSCCICLVAWAAALVLGVFDSSALKRQMIVGSAGQAGAGGLKNDRREPLMTAPVTSTLV